MVTRDHGSAPSFSAVLLGGLAVAPLPLMVPNLVLKRFMKILCGNHPAMLERLQPIEGKTFFIDIVDLPFQLLLRVQSHTIWAELTRAKNALADVVIKGELISLLEMLKSDVDGDSLFFSRKLSVEGDTEALLTLRNALDADDIHVVDEILSGFGPLQYPLRQLVTLLKPLWKQANDKMALLNESLLVAANHRMDVLGAKTEGLEKKIETLNTTISSQQRKINHLTKMVEKKT